MRKYTYLIIIFLFALLLSSDAMSATRTASVTGNWSSTATWGGSAVPTSADAVIINAGITVTVDVDAYCASLTYAAVTTNSYVTINGTNSLTITGILSMPRPSTSRSCYMNINAGALSCGSLTMSATTSGRNNIINITTGTVTVSGNITTGTTGCQIIFTSTGTLNVGGNFSSTPTLTTVAGSTVNYNGTGAQTMYFTNYSGNVICSGSGTKTFGTSGLTRTISGDLTVKTGSELSTANIASLQLSVNGVFTVESGATVNVGGLNGGRIVVSGTGKSHIISGTVNIYWALRFDHTTTSTSTISVTNGAVITNDYTAQGQLAINYGVTMTIESGAFLINNTDVQTQALCGINIMINNNPKLIINGTLTNGNTGTLAGGSIFNGGSLTVNGLFNYPRGFWISGSNVVVYGPTGTLAYVGGALTSSNDEWPAANSPYNVIINSTGNIIMHAARTINGTLSLMQSNLVNGTYLTMGNGATINRSGGTISQAPTFTTKCNVIYSNSTSITTGPELPTGTILNNLTFEGTSGQSVTLNANPVVTDTLTMTSGNIITGTNTLTLGSSTSNLGTLSRNSGAIIGKFARWFDATVPAVFSLFPMGSASHYRPVEIKYSTAPSSGGTLTVEYFGSNPGNNGNPASITDGGYTIDVYSNEVYWTITSTITGGNYDINLHATGITGVSTEETKRQKLRILKRANSTSNWTVDGSHLNADAGPIVKRTGLTNFSEFGIGSNYTDNPLQGPLPVKLASFNSIVAGRDVKLNWVTESEENNSGFEIQKSGVSSKEIGDWMKIGFINGKGTKNTQTNYSFEERNLQTGKYKYRLKQIDYNGNYEYFELAGIVEVGIPAKYDLSQNYPNPFNPVTKINFDLPYDSKVSIKLYDMSGREVITLVNEQRQAGCHTVQMNAGSLSSGTYFYRIIAEGNGQNFVMTKKAVLIK